MPRQFSSVYSTTTVWALAGGRPRHRRLSTSPLSPRGPSFLEEGARGIAAQVGHRQDIDGLGRGAQQAAGAAEVDFAQVAAVGHGLQHPDPGQPEPVTLGRREYGLRVSIGGRGRLGGLQDEGPTVQRGPVMRPGGHQLSSEYSTMIL